VHVHLHFIGETEEAKRPGAIMNHAITELEVECRVADIPEEIRVDLTKFTGNVNVGDITLPPGVKTRLDPASPVVTVSFVHREEAVGEVVEVEATAEPEVIGAAKREAEEGEESE
jgi:large subunit ribosomal protein L25